MNISLTCSLEPLLLEYPWLCSITERLNEPLISFELVKMNQYLYNSNEIEFSDLLEGITVLLDTLPDIVVEYLYKKSYMSFIIVSFLLSYNIRKLPIGIADYNAAVIDMVHTVVIYNYQSNFGKESAKTSFTSLGRILKTPEKLLTIIANRYISKPTCEQTKVVLH